MSGRDEDTPQWYYVTDAKESVGPVPLSEMRSAFAAAKITADSYVFNGTDGSKDWLRLSALPDVLKALQAGGAPPKPAAAKPKPAVPAAAAKPAARVASPTPAAAAPSSAASPAPAAAAPSPVASPGPAGAVAPGLARAQTTPSLPGGSSLPSSPKANTSMRMPPPGGAAPMVGAGFAASTPTASSAFNASSPALQKTESTAMTGFGSKDVAAAAGKGAKGAKAGAAAAGNSSSSGKSVGGGPSVPPPPFVDAKNDMFFVDLVGQSGDQDVVALGEEDDEAVDPNKIDKQGWLTKEGRMVKTWKQRWFVLQGSTFKYFENRDAKHPKGAIALETCVVRQCTRDGKHMIELLTEGRKLYFVADSPEQQLAWVVALNTKIALLTYLKKLKMQDQSPNQAILRFFSTTDAPKLVVRDDPLSLEAATAIGQPLRFHAHCVDITLFNVGLDDLHVQLLAESLAQNKSLKRLDLSSNSLGPEGGRVLSGALAQNPVVSTVVLRNNILGDQGAASMASILVDKIGAPITTLVLDNNDVGDPGATALAKVLDQTALPTVHLAFNAIMDEGAAALGAALANNPAVRVVHLEHNRIGDAGATALAKSLHRNTVLERLALCSNYISNAGAAELAQALRQNRTLKMLELGANKMRKDGLTALAKECPTFVFSALELLRKDSRRESNML